MANYPSNWGQWLRDVGIGEYNPEVEQYARANGLSYEMGAWQIYQQRQAQQATPAPAVQTSTPAVSEYVPPAQTVDDILNQAVDSVVSIIKEPPKPYEEVNPFFFDEALAREASSAEYSPFYQELLTDYIQKVQKIVSRSQEDLTKTLDYLSKTKEQYLGEERRILDEANKATNEGYEGVGLYFSGARGRKLQETGKQFANRLGSYMTGYEQQRTGAQTESQRTIEDVTKEQELYNRDIERQRTTAIEGGILQRKGEAQEEYLAGMQKYYSNYPNYYTEYGAVSTPGQV